MEAINATQMILSLIGQFKSGRDSKKQNEYNQFLEWLIRENHNEIYKEIEKLKGIEIGIKVLLKIQGDDLSDKLDVLLDSIENKTTEIITKLKSLYIIQKHNHKETSSQISELKDTVLDVFNQELPIDLIDSEIKKQLNRIIKLRFFSNFELVENVVKLANLLTEGNLQKGTPEIKCLALSWCARLITHEDIDESIKYIKEAKRHGLLDIIDIAEAFEIAQSGDVDSAIAKITSKPSPSNYSAAIMIINKYNGAELALSWKKDTGLKFSDFDIDGKITLFSICFNLGKWDDALHYAKQVNIDDYKDNPGLLNVLAMAYLLNAVPIPYRYEILNQIPFRISPFQFSSDSNSLEYRKKAMELFKKCFLSLTKYGNEAAANISDDYALWIELYDIELSGNAKQLLENNMETGGILALRRFPLAMQLQLDVDLNKIESELNKQTALTGGKSVEVAIARFAIAFKQKKPHEYIEKHREQLFTYIQKPFVYSLEIDSLIVDEEFLKVEKILEELEQDKSVEKKILKNLQNQYVVSQSNNKLTLLIKEYEGTHFIGDLTQLVNQLEIEDNFELLDKYAVELFKRTTAIKDAERIVNTKIFLNKMNEASQFLQENESLVSQSEILQEHKAWVLFREGKIHESREELQKLKLNRDHRNIKSLEINLAITSGQWSSLATYVESEWISRESRTAEELLQAAKIAQAIKSIRARDLVLEAANKESSNPEILFSSYMSATSMGWENEPIVKTWFKSAVDMSGVNGPIKSYSLREMVDKSKEWRNQDSEIWVNYNKGLIPASLLDKLLGKSLTELYLLPALANQNEKDLRKCIPIPAYSNVRGIIPIECNTVTLDLTALFTLGYLGIISLITETFEKIYIPHSTLTWLFREKEKAAFHQPSRIKESKKYVQLIVDGKLNILEKQLIKDSSLALEIGDELALMLQETKVAKEEGSNQQRLVVVPYPVHKISSLMGKEADLSMYHQELCNCSAVVNKLYEKGSLTEEEKDNAINVLQQQGDKEWPIQVQIEDDAILFLDDISVKYLQYAGILEKMEGMTIFVHPEGANEYKELRMIENFGQKAECVIEEIRAVLAQGIDQRIIELCSTPEELANTSKANNFPMLELFKAAELSDTVIVDDRVLNNNRNINFNGNIKPVATTLDLLDTLKLKGTFSEQQTYSYKTKLRKAGFIFVPIDIQELNCYFDKAKIIDGVIQETAELKLIRKNLDLIKISNFVYLPKDIEWLSGIFTLLISYLKLQWEESFKITEAIARSNWILRLLNYEDWAHFYEGESGYDLATNGKLYLMKDLILNSYQIKQKADYFQWIEKSLLNPLKFNNPKIYHKLVDTFKNNVSDLIRKQMEQEGKEQ